MCVEGEYHRELVGFERAQLTHLHAARAAGGQATAAGLVVAEAPCPMDHDYLKPQIKQLRCLPRNNGQRLHVLLLCTLLFRDGGAA